jgi:hypothetical protein
VKSSLARIALFAGLAAAAGCSNQPLPLSAQAGSTIVIPIDPQPPASLGYGGTELADPQRGSLVYVLCEGDPGPPVPLPVCDPPGDCELTTRFSLLAEHDPRSANARDAVIGARAQAFSVVDIPSDAPPGEHALCVVRRDAQGIDHPVELVAPSAWEPTFTLRILPASVPVDGEPPVVGAPNPSEVWSWFSQSWVPKQDALPQLAPEPTLDIRFVESPGSEVPVPLHAVDLVVVYPENVIDAVRAVPPTGLRNASFWIQPIAPGWIRIRGAAGDAFDELGLVFRLNAPATPLEVDDVQVALLATGDRNGAALTASPQLGAIR